MVYYEQHLLLRVRPDVALLGSGPPPAGLTRIRRLVLAPFPAAHDGRTPLCLLHLRSRRSLGAPARGAAPVHSLTAGSATAVVRVSVRLPRRSL